MFIYSRIYKNLPPDFNARLFKLGTLAITAPSAINIKLQHAAIAPTMISIVPTAQPVRANTYGNDSTPDPIAAAQREKILPLTLPFSSLPNVLLKNVLLPPIDEGERGVFYYLILI